MSDRYLEMSQTPWGKSLISLLGLPKPPALLRPQEPWQDRFHAGRGALLGAAPGGTLVSTIATVLSESGADIRVRPELEGFEGIKSAAAECGVALSGTPVSGEESAGLRSLVFDATGITHPDGLRALYDFFQPLARGLLPHGRIVLLGGMTEECTAPAAAAACAALTGFVKSLGKEAGRNGTTVNLIRVGNGAEDRLSGALRFLLSTHSAFVSGQTLQVAAQKRGPKKAVWEGSLKGKVALVTGAARGIGAAISATLAREGAQVIGVDRPQEEGALGATLSAFQGVGVPLDITAPDAGARIREACLDRFGGLDLIVHNAGITRDKMLRNMPVHYWDQVLSVNLASIVRVNEDLLGHQSLNAGARMVCVSSIGGIAGNAGQTNYGATKAGVIGYVASLSAEMAKLGGAVNAVAPGFIETQMTASMPMGPRVMGRLMSSLLQGGLPEDIAEAVAFLGSPASAGVNGQTLRVCGQHLVGA